jgi:predicted Zn-dependent protease
VLPIRSNDRTLVKVLFGCALAMSVTLFVQVARGHADLLLQIEEATKEIQNDPKNPDLYLKRGELRRQHVEWDMAHADFDRALALAPDLAIVDMLRGRVYLESGWPLSALACLNRFLSIHPKHVEAQIVRARIRTRLGQRLSATKDYTGAIALSTEPGPDLFIERAQALAASGNEYLKESLRGLDEGIAKMGSLVTLQLFAIDVELKQQNYEGALARVDKIAEKSPRKETWQVRRGEILQLAGRPAEARQAYQSALSSLQTLPPTRRFVPAMQELEKRIKRELVSLGDPAQGEGAKQ